MLLQVSDVEFFYGFCDYQKEVYLVLHFFHVNYLMHNTLRADPRVLRDSYVLVRSHAGFL